VTFERLFILGLCAHIVADWFFQSDWQAQHKTSLKHPAAYIHSSIHLAALLFVFAWPVAFAVAVSHLLIDTRKPLVWWRSLMRTKQFDPAQEPHSMHNMVSFHVAFWQDQMSHVLAIALAAWLCNS
jgi:hypothetical protein